MKKKERIDLHALIESAILKACDGTSRNVYVIAEAGDDAANRSTVYDYCVQTARELIASGRIQKIGGRYRVAHIGTGHEEMPVALTEEEAFSRTDTSRPDSPHDPDGCYRCRREAAKKTTKPRTKPRRDPSQEPLIAPMTPKRKGRKP